jgi:HEAT repeat protein
MTAKEGGYIGLENIEKQLAPAIRALTRTPKDGNSVRDALVRAAADPDVEVRLGVRRTFEEMARARRFLTDLRNSLPPLESLKEAEKLPKPKEDPDKDKKKGKDDLGWRGGGGRVILVSAQQPPPQLPVLRLPPPPGAARAQDKDKKAEKIDEPKDKDKPKDDLDKPREDAKEEEDPHKDEPLDRDALGKTLVGIGRDIIRRGVTDTNPAGRRASLEAIEAMGETGKVFLPQLVQALKDSDKFVRWIAARALGKLAPLRAREVVPALVCLLEEVDLDVRLAGIEAIGMYETSAVSAVPALTEIVNKGDAESRIAVMRALESIGPKAASALPAMRPLLINLDPRLRAEAARVMGQFGSLAREYLPDLRRLLRDPDSEVRRTASAAIIFITDAEKKK